LPSVLASLRARLARFGAVGPAAAIAFVMPQLGGLLLLGALGLIAPWLRAHPDLGLALFVAGVALASGLALLSTYTQALLGGWVFGGLLGTAATVLGLEFGAVIGYLLGLRVAGRRLARVLEDEPRARAVHRALLGSGWSRASLIVTLVRLPPHSPFASFNLLFAATRTPWLAFLLGTLVGMTPRTAVVALLGAGLSALSERPRADFGLMLASLLLSLLVLWAIGRMASQAVHRAGLA
jgi:uncharacterized membrane protein YdjX (TVP38/TMEM64 family)